MTPKRGFFNFNVRAVHIAKISDREVTLKSVMISLSECYCRNGDHYLSVLHLNAEETVLCLVFRARFLVFGTDADDAFNVVEFVPVIFVDQNFIESVGVDGVDETTLNNRFCSLPDSVLGKKQRPNPLRMLALANELARCPEKLEPKEAVTKEN